MYIYTFAHTQKSFEPEIIEIDLLQMLDGNEVLAFGLDDSVAFNKYGTICVQAKNLSIYEIDFIQN
jgi:hypothetical protein